MQSEEPEDITKSIITSLQEELGEYRQFFAEITPLLEKLDKNPELTKAILKGNITAELAKAFTEESTDPTEYPEEECQCGNHEEHKRLLNPENYDANGNELEEVPDWYDGSRAEYDNYKDSTD